MKEAALDITVARVFNNARRFGQPLKDGLSLLDWPWTWHRVAGNLQYLEAVYTRASALNVDPPPRAIIFNQAEVDAYFDAAREELSSGRS